MIGQHGTCRRDSGSTLAEMMVVLALFTVVGLMVATTVISGQRSVQDDLNKVSGVAQAQVGLDESSKLLRTAGKPDVSTTSARQPFVAGTATDVTFYASLCSAITQVRLYVDGTDQLVERLAPDSSPSQVRTRVLARPLTSGSTVFTYLQANGTPMTLTGGALTPAQLGTVSGVRLTLSVAATGGHSSLPTTVQTDVALPNGQSRPYAVTNPGAC